MQFLTPRRYMVIKASSMLYVCYTFLVIFVNQLVMPVIRISCNQYTRFSMMRHPYIIVPSLILLDIF